MATSPTAAEIEVLALSSIQVSLAVLKATGKVPANLLVYVQDGIDAISKALAAHNAAQTDQTKPLDPLNEVS